jgi:hypothetical protein
VSTLSTLPEAMTVLVLVLAAVLAARTLVYVATDEIKFGDNDTLAALVANLVGASQLVILTDQKSPIGQKLDFANHPYLCKGL